MILRHTVLMLSCSAALFSMSPLAQAQTAPTEQATAALAPTGSAPYSWSGNLNLVNEYRFRGIDQTWGHPALQGGIDWNHADGWYAGTWLSNVSQRSYPGGNLELDVYGGYNGKIDAEWSYTVGLYGYLYPGANLQHAHCPSAAFAAPCGGPLADQGYDTLEANAGLSWRWLSYKLSFSATDYFGANSKTGYSKRTRGTLYHDLTVTVPLLTEGLNLIMHAGYTDINADVAGHDPSYTDWRLSLSKTFSDGWNASLGMAGASNDRFYRPPSGGLSASDGATRALNRNTFLLQVGKTF